MDKEAQIKYFEALLEQNGENYLALDWNSVESQRLRFRILKEILLYGKKTANISILDIGCGLGDLYGFFKAEGLLNRHRISYTGCDISPKLVAAAKKKYPDAKFEVKDILAERYLCGADYLFCSGVFNIRTTDRNEHLDFVKEMICRTFDLAKHGAALNFLSEGALPISDREEMDNGRYFYFKPDEIANFCRFVCGRFILRHDYHPGDFTVFLLK